MKAPATRVVRTAAPAPTTRIVRTARHAEKSRRADRRKRGPARRLLALGTIAIGAWLVVLHAGGAGGAGGADLLGRVLGAGSAGIGVAYRAASDGLRAVGATFAGEGPGPKGPGIAVPTVTARSNPRAVSGVTSGGVPVGVPGAPRSPSPGPSRREAIPAVAPRTPSPIRIGRPPPSVSLPNDYQVYETWNNCGPASLSMALSYFGIHQSQAALGQALRPYQNQQGDNDDKDVTMEELAHQARKYGLLAYHRPNGSIALLKHFLASGMPVIVETVLTKDDDIGHYRVVKGYDDASGTILQDDSMQGHNVRFSYADFDSMWKKYNYEYLVLVPGTSAGWRRRSSGRISPREWHGERRSRWIARRSRGPVGCGQQVQPLGCPLLHRGLSRLGSRVRAGAIQLPPRTLWYQIEPIEAYYALGDYPTVFSLSNAILNDGDRAFSQLYILRGRIDQKQGNMRAARAEFTDAVRYNVHLQQALDALASLS